MLPLSSTSPPAHRRWWFSRRLRIAGTLAVLLFAGIGVCLCWGVRQHQRLALDNAVTHLLTEAEQSWEDVPRIHSEPLRLWHCCRPTASFPDDSLPDKEESVQRSAGADAVSSQGKACRRRGKGNQSRSGGGGGGQGRTPARFGNSGNVRASGASRSCRNSASARLARARTSGGELAGVDSQPRSRS